MFIDRRMDKGVVVYIYSGILLSHKKNEIMPICSGSDGLEIIIGTDAQAGFRKGRGTRDQSANIR